MQVSLEEARRTLQQGSRKAAVLQRIVVQWIELRFIQNWFQVILRVFQGAFPLSLSLSLPASASARAGIAQEEP